MQRAEPHWEQRVADLARRPLSQNRALFADSAQLASSLRVGSSRFLREHGFRSEWDYKLHCMREGKIMYHAHIGLGDAAETASALCWIDERLRAAGWRLDRAGFALDRRMGLPPARRREMPAETGPLLQDRDDWRRLADCAEVQPHFGDFMIGQPASVENTVQALRAGCTTIGNLSQFFTFQAPGWRDAAATAAETTRAIALLGRLRERGALLHSYLEDGYGALFSDCATLAGWAYLERYIVEELCGAKLSHCIGGLTCDPIKRAGWAFALQEIHGGDCVGSMFYGDTISFGDDFESNRAVVAEYLQWDILAQLHRPSGHALLPLPVSEAQRIPSAEEIFSAQVLGRRIEQSARRLLAHVDFTAAQAFADDICARGREVYVRALAGLEQGGVDVRDPQRLLYVLKELGATAFEALFAVPSGESGLLAGERVARMPPTPSVPTDMYQLSKGLSVRSPGSVSQRSESCAVTTAYVLTGL